MQKHKLLAFLLALVVSVGLWLYAVTVVNPNDTKKISDVSISIEGAQTLLDNDLILTGGEGQTVDVEVSGRRSDLKELDNRSLKAVARVSNINRAGTQSVTWELVTPESVASGDIKLVTPKKTEIKVTVSEKITLPEIPVKVEYEGEIDTTKFLRDEAELSAETLSVSGPAEEISKIDHALVTVPLDGKTANISDEYDCVFYDAGGNALTLSSYVTVPTPSVHVTVPISAYKQITLKAKLLAGGGATANDAECKFEPSSILVTGTEEAIAEMQDTLEVEIDLAKITEIKQIWTFTPTLQSGVTNRADNPEVKVTVTLKGLKTREFTIDCAEITVSNGEDTGLEIAQQTVTVKVRGKTDAVNALTLETITAAIRVDMSDYDQAAKKVKLIFDVLPNGVGVLGGPYTVTVSETA